MGLHMASQSLFESTANCMSMQCVKTKWVLQGGPYPHSWEVSPDGPACLLSDACLYTFAQISAITPSHNKTTEPSSQDFHTVAATVCESCTYV